MTSPAVICPVTDIDTLITDDGVSAEALESFKRSGVEVIVV
jgi:DeoR/GlpR family transcriptional regulator of sugar metabolism